MSASALMEKLFWEKYRPKKISNMVLYDRIRNSVMSEDGSPKISNNYLFTSTSSGTGKSTLARIMTSVYFSININASLYGSVDDLRTVVTEFCQTKGDIFDTRDDSIKLVLLDEFDGVSKQYQEGLRAFIEEYEGSVRFLATCNNIDKISGPMLSRFDVISFDPKNNEERQYLTEKYIDRLTAIAQKEKITIDEDSIRRLVVESLPDFRRILNELQSIATNGVVPSKNAEYKDMFHHITNGTSTTDMYDIVISDWGDRPEVLINSFGRPFSEWLMKMHSNKIGTLPKILHLVSAYSSRMKDSTDPIVHALALIYDLQELFK